VKEIRSPPWAREGCQQRSELWQRTGTIFEQFDIHP
jgi:hypothetical protein